MDIGTWLREAGLGQYEPAFRANAITVELLPSLTPEDLKELGVAAVGDRRRLLNAIAQSGAARTASEPERRQTAVLFADLAGYTRLSAALDPEETHEVLDGFFAEADRLVGLHGGTVDKHIGDCVMAIFGAPIAHGNDAERAAHAAIAIRDAMPSLSRRLGHQLEIHAGLALGEVVASTVGGAGHRSYTVTGESVNRAARLTQHAQPGEILLSPEFRNTLDDKADCEEVASLAAKGYDVPLIAWRLLAIRRAGSQLQALVGREAERAQFTAALEACRRRGRGQTAHIRGEAGIGKTRLADEMRRVAGSLGFACHVARALDFGLGSGHDPARALARSLLDCDPKDEPAAIDATIAGGAVSEDRRVFLYDLLDLPPPPSLRAVYDAMDDAGRERALATTLAELALAAARRQPLLILIEDLHWADDATLGRLTALGTSAESAPILLVTTSRLEGDPLHTRWHPPGPLAVLELGPLHRTEALTLAESIMTRDAFAERCVERAAGNPLFLLELLRNAREGGEVPGTVQSVAQARLDRLRPADKAALQAAAVFGQQLPLEALRSVLGDPQYDPGALVAAQFLRPSGDDLVFSHALIREAVYATLLRRHRRELHRRAADWYAGRDAALRAEHLACAEDASAANAYLAAARERERRYRYEEALTLAERGLALATVQGDAFELSLVKAGILLDAGRAREAAVASTEAIGRADSDSRRARALVARAAARRVIDELDGAFADLVSAEPASCADPALAARLHGLRGNLLFPRGEIEACLAEHRASLEFARAAGNPELEAAALGGIGDAEYARSRMLTANRRFRASIALAIEHGLGRIEVANRPMAAITDWYAREVHACLDEARDAVAAAARVGHKRAEIIAHHAAYFCAHSLTEWDLARSHVDAALALARELGARRFEAETLAFRSAILRWAGDRQLALAHAREALAICRETGMTFMGPIVLAVLARATSDHAERRAALDEGEALLSSHSVSHNHHFFRRDAIDVSLESDMPEEALRHAAALEAYTSAERLPTIDLFILRARVLAAAMGGSVERREIERLCKQATRLGHLDLLPAAEALLIQ